MKKYTMFYINDRGQLVHPDEALRKSWKDETTAQRKRVQDGRGRRRLLQETEKSTGRMGHENEVVKTRNVTFCEVMKSLERKKK